ncbi:MAG TPA: hypothetical protein VKE74_24300, partial [Gemmataceae bacterium]|nr:hypothetical protein [Gemmataceae bacterium]
MRLLTTAPGQVLALAFSPDADALAVAVEHQGVYLWNLAAAGKPVVLDTAAYRTRTRTLLFAPDGRSVGWLAWNRWKVYDRDAREAVEKPLDPRGQLLDLVHTPDGSRVVSKQHSLSEPALVGWAVGANGWVQDWSVSTWDLSVRDRGLAVDPAGRRVAVVCQPTRQSPRSARWWEEHPVRVDLRSAVSGVVQATSPYPYQHVDALVFAPD